MLYTNGAYLIADTITELHTFVVFHLNMPFDKICTKEKVVSVPRKPPVIIRPHYLLTGQQLSSAIANGVRYFNCENAWEDILFKRLWSNMDCSWRICSTSKYARLWPSRWKPAGVRVCDPINAPGALWDPREWTKEYEIKEKRDKKADLQKRRERGERGGKGTGKGRNR